MKKYLSLVAFSHTIFALPFALVGLSIGLKLHQPENFLQKTVLVVLCMVFARSAAMAFNRYLDRRIDAKNPRTVTREIPSGAISPNAALGFVFMSSFLFFVTTYFINFKCFALAPVALLVVLGYSFTKRFTWLCHFVLGLGLSLAPIGAYLATGGNFDAIPLIFSVVILFWVGGFDIIYALQDEDFDKKQSLHSVPTWLGAKKALRVSEFAHLVAAAAMLLVSVLLQKAFPESLGFIHWIGALIFLTMLYYQHKILNINDLSNINRAFFTTNGLASVLYGSLFLIDFWLI